MTLIDPVPAPMSRALGVQAGRLMASVHRRARVDLRLNTSVAAVRAISRVRKLTLSDGSMLRADTLIVAVGSCAATGWLFGSGLDIDDGIRCDEHLRAIGGGARVVAVGDVCRWPAGRGTERSEHWTGAAEQAAIAARTLLHGQGPHPQPVPFCWSEQHGRRLQAIGSPADADAGLQHPGPVSGSAEPTWTTTFTREGHLVGAVALDMPGRIAKVRRELLAHRGQAAVTGEAA